MKCGYYDRPRTTFPCNKCEYKDKDCLTERGREPLTCRHCRWWSCGVKPVCHHRKGTSIRPCKHFEWDQRGEAKMNVCKERGVYCELATDLGFCSVTVCMKQNRVSNIPIIPIVTVTDSPMVEYAPIVRCKDCRHANECHKSVQYTRNEQSTVTIGYSPIEWCSRGERREL